MLIKIKAKRKQRLDDKILFINDFYTFETSVLAKYLEKLPVDYFKFLRLEIPLNPMEIAKLYVKEQDFNPDALLIFLEKTYPKYDFEVLDRPFTDYKVLEEIVFRTFTKVNTPDVPFKMYTTKKLTKNTMDYLNQYLDLLEDNKYVLKQVENPKTDPMYMYKKSYLILDKKKRSR